MGGAKGFNFLKSPTDPLRFARGCDNWFGFPIDVFYDMCLVTVFAAQCAVPICSARGNVRHPGERWSLGNGIYSGCTLGS